MRKLLAGILALVMIMSLFTFASAADKDVITVTVFRGDPGDQPTDDNKIYKMIEEEFGIKFEFEFLAGDLDETLGTKIAGEDYPDLFDGANSAEKIIDAGALIDLLPYISEEKTPNLYNHIKDLLPQLVNEDGELFIIPNYGINYNAQIQNYCNGPSFFIQKQVLAWAGYPQIKTLNEYFDLLERFLAANPDALIEADVEVTELMGSETYLYLKTSGKEENIIARVDPRTASRAGQKIKVAFDVARLHFFDKETEATLLNR